MLHTLLFLALAPLGQGLRGPLDEPPPLERQGLLELTLPERSGVRAEHFRLTLPGADAPGPVGVARLVRVEDEDGAGRLEWETTFFDARVRVLHVERLERDALTLVWRELGVRHGRTVRVSFDLASNELQVSDVGGAAARGRALELGEGAFMPLFLLEQDRAGRLSPGVFRRVDPSAGAIDTVKLSRGAGPLPWLAGARVSRWTRADGTLAGRYVFAGGALLSFELQQGGPVASAIGLAEYEGLLAEAAGGIARR
jgi:hypothetical protein